MPSTTVYFGDLLTTLDRMGLAGQLTAGGSHPDKGEKISQVAAAFGLEWQAPLPAAPPLEESPSQVQKIEPKPSPEPVPAPSPEPTQKLEFWAVLRKRTRSPEEVEQPPEELRNVPPLPPDKWSLRGAPLRGAPLMPWSRLWPFLRRILGHQRPSRSPDLPRLVRAIVAGRSVHRLPRRWRSAWCPEVALLVDRRTAMTPFWDDFDDIIARIRTLRGSGCLRVVAVEADAHGLLSHRTLEPLQLPRDVSATAVLALGDLGQYAGGLMAAAWASWGRRARAAGFTPWALCPCPQDRWFPSVAQAWNVIAWDRHGRPPQDGTGQRALPWAAEEREAVVKRRSQQLHSLLRLVSPAIRVERGFLRDVRFLLDHSAADAGTEYDAFQSPDVVGSGEGLSLTVQRQREMRAELARDVPPDLLLELLRLMRRHHAYSAAIFGAEELEGLKQSLPTAMHPLLAQSGLLTPESEAQASLHWRQIADGLLHHRFGRHQEAMKSYALRSITRVEETISASAAKQVIWALASPEPEDGYPSHVSPSTLAFLQKRNRMPSLQIVSVADGLRVGALPPHEKIPLTSLYTRWQAASVTVEGNGQGLPRKFPWRWKAEPMLDGAALDQATRIHIEAGIQTVELGKLQRPAWASRMWYEGEKLKAQFDFKDQTHIFENTWVTEVEAQPDRLFYHETGWQVFDWTCESPPSWASRLWVDKFGLAAEFRIRSVPFILRWIPPGSFLMGSPEDEPGRDQSEGPLHQVEITQGYWIGETQVTQAQWRTVVEEAEKKLALVSQLDTQPSYFKGPFDLPVESVSWADSVMFCRLLNALLPDGPEFQLPTEAQWEYACRLDSSNSPFVGPLEFVQEVLSPELDPFAWYAGNCSESIDTTNARDGQSRPKRQLRIMRGGTHRVKKKAPNALGLFDMLGNVWEWCHDAWVPSAYVDRKSGVSDPCSMMPDERGRRVARGGSWQNEASFCRVAMRNWDIPEARSSNQGLRLSAGRKRINASELERIQDRKSVWNFSPRAQQMLAMARKEADRLGNDFVGVEHLVLGLIKLGNGIGWKLLQRALADLEKLRTEMEKLCGSPKAQIPNNIPYTPRVKLVLSLSRKEAAAFGNDYVGTEHILLGVLREGDGPAARVLLSLGLSLDQCREEIRSDGYLRANDEHQKSG